MSKMKEKVLVVHCPDCPVIVKYNVFIISLKNVWGGFLFFPPPFFNVTWNVSVI